MLDQKINTCLNIIKNKRTQASLINEIDGRHDDDWCTAYNHLLSSLLYHKPARAMLEFGKSSRSRSTTLSWNKRIAWLRRYCNKYDVKFCGSGCQAFRKWSSTITYETKMPPQIGDVGSRIARRMKHQRRMDGYSAYSRGRWDG